MRSKEKQYYIHELIKFKYKIANKDIDFSFEDISEVSKIHTSIGETVSYIVDLEKEIERIKSLDIYKLVEDADTGQLIHKDKIRDKIKELEQKTVIAQGEELLIFDAKKDILKELLEGE